MEELYNLLNTCRPDIDFTKENNLIDGGVLESLDIVMLVGMLCDEYDIEISMDDLLPENFNSAEAIYELVHRLQEEV